MYIPGSPSAMLNILVKLKIILISHLIDPAYSPPKFYSPRFFYYLPSSPVPPPFGHHSSNTSLSNISSCISLFNPISLHHVIIHQILLFQISLPAFPYSTPSPSTMPPDLLLLVHLCTLINPFYFSIPWASMYAPKSFLYT